MRARPDLAIESALWDFGTGVVARPSALWLSMRGPDVRINEQARKTVVFLGVLDDKGEFAPYGTGFIALWPEGDVTFSYLVTAKHVAEDMERTRRPMAVRLNARDGTAQVGRIASEFWATHLADERCDIAVAGFGGSPETFDVDGIDLASMSLTEQYVADNDIGCGDVVYMAGLFVSHFGAAKNEPIVRMGNIATMPNEPVYLNNEFGYQRVYLVEMRSIGGLSGSPVFLQTQPFRICRGAIKSMEKHRSEYILGVNIGLLQVKAHGDTLPADTVAKRESFLEMMSAGIAVVVPIQRAIEIIRDFPRFQEGRSEALKQLSDRVGFVKTSGGRALPDSGADNPAPTEDADWLGPTEAARLRDATLRNMLNTPPKPHSEMKLGKARRR